MANEIQTPGTGTGRTIYATLHNRTSGYVWNTSGGTGAFESFVSGNWGNYQISLTEQGVSNYYVGNMPAAIPAGVYDIQARQQVGGSAAQTDPHVAGGEVQWNGSAPLPLSDLATSGQLGLLSPIRLARGTMILNMPLYLRSSVDHITPFTSGVLSGQISRDGAAFGVLQSGAFTEIGQGWYKLAALTSGDLLANTAALIFSANGISGGAADPLPLSFLLNRTSGQ